MRTSFLLAIAMVTLLSCATNTRIVHSWRDPDTVINTSTSNKFIVAALLKNESVRRRTENLMSVYYPGKAVSSYKRLGTPALKENQAFYDEKLKSEGFDAIVVIRLVKADNIKYTPGSYPDYYYSWTSYYNYAWPGYYDPRDRALGKKYYVEVNVYSLVSNKLVWSGTTSTINPSGTDDLFDNVINTMNERMKKEGFLSER